jgi:predicted dehydrogenase
MGRWHAYYARQAGAEVAAIVDPREQSAHMLQARFPAARVFNALPNCLKECHIDLVHVCAPLGLHAPLAEHAMAAGKHVLLEKPAAETAAKTADLICLAHDKGLALCVTHQFPFQHGFARLRQARERLGELVHVRYCAFSAGGTGLTAAGRRNLLLEILPHPFSLFIALAGTSLDGSAWHVLHGSDTDLEMTARFAGAQWSVLISLRGRPTRNDLTVVGTRGTAHLNLFHGYCVLQAGGPSRLAKVVQPLRNSAKELCAAGANLARRALRCQPAYPGLGELVRQLYASVLKGQAGPVSPAEMLGVAGLIDQARTPAHSPGGPMTLRYGSRLVGHGGERVVQPRGGRAPPPYAPSPPGLAAELVPAREKDDSPPDAQAC